MKSPVSLCTGVTYDRSSIQKWLDSGNNTCPATMQPLLTKDFTPNHTLQRLIHTWESLSPQQNPSLHSLLQSLSSSSSVSTLTQIADFLQSPDPESNKKNRDSIVNSGFLPILLGLISGGGKDGCLELEFAESVFGVLKLVFAEVGSEVNPKSTAISVDPKAFLLVLQKGSLRSRIAAAKVLEALILITGDVSIAEKEGILPELFMLMSEKESDNEAIDAGVSCMVAVAGARRRTRPEIVRLGVVPVLGRVLARTDSGENALAEKALKLVEMASTCAEGRAAIIEDPACIPAIVHKLLKVSYAGTERAVVVLWSVCHLFRDRRAQEAVAECNGLTKILLVMQSGCSAGVRQMCGDLVKIFRVNSKSCLSGYDTKTTHIMPF